VEDELEQSTAFELISIYAKVWVCFVLNKKYQCTSGLQNRSGPRGSHNTG